MNVVVLGTGAVSGYYGGQLARAGHEVTCFARGESLAAIRQHGLEIRTPDGTFRANVSGTDRPEALAPPTSRFSPSRAIRSSRSRRSFGSAPSKGPPSCPC